MRTLRETTTTSKIYFSSPFIILKLVSKPVDFSLLVLVLSCEENIVCPSQQQFPITVSSGDS